MTQSSPVVVRVASDPHVSVTQQLDAEERKLVVIELKGGTDVSVTVPAWQSKAISFRQVLGSNDGCQACALGHRDGIH